MQLRMNSKIFVYYQTTVMNIISIECSLLENVHSYLEVRGSLF